MTNIVKQAIKKKELLDENFKLKPGLQLQWSENDGLWCDTYSLL